MTRDEKDEVEQFLGAAKGRGQNTYSIHGAVVVHSGNMVMVINEAEVMHVDEYDDRCLY